MEKGYSQDSHPQVGNPYVLGLVAQLCPTLWDAMDWSPPCFSVHGDSPGKKTGVDCQALLQGMFPTQESNPGLLHCRQILYQLSKQGSPRIKEANLLKIRNHRWLRVTEIIFIWEMLFIIEINASTTIIRANLA